jgi:hypothetical protein
MQIFRAIPQMLYLPHRMPDAGAERKPVLLS